MKRMTKEEFSLLIFELFTIGDSHNHAVEIGGEGKVVVLRWAVSGSAERTEKKVLFASQSPSMVQAAFEAFSAWYKEEEDELHAGWAAQQRAEQAAEAAYERHLEDAGWMDAAWQDQHEAKYAPLDPQSGLYGQF